MGILTVLKIVKEVAEIVLPFLAWRKKRRAEKTLNAVITGVEAYTKAEGTSADKVKAVIKEIATKNNVERFLSRVVKKITK